MITSNEMDGVLLLENEEQSSAADTGSNTSVTVAELDAMTAIADLKDSDSRVDCIDHTLLNDTIPGMELKIVIHQDKNRTDQYPCSGIAVKIIIKSAKIQDYRASDHAGSAFIPDKIQDQHHQDHIRRQKGVRMRISQTATHNIPGMTSSQWAESNIFYETENAEKGKYTHGSSQQYS